MEQRNSGAGRKEELTNGAARSVAERASVVRASSADRWARGRLLASARGERGLARAALVGAGRWQAERGWRVGPRKGGAGAGRAVVWAVRGERSGRQGFDLGRDLGLSWVLGFFLISISNSNKV